MTSKELKGSHVYVEETHRYNSNTIGVCFEGEFRTEVMDEKQLEASDMLLSVFSLGYGNIDICTHNYWDRSTTCLGKNFPSKELLQKVHDKNKSSLTSIATSRRLITNSN